MKGWACLLQLLLDLVSAVILRSESRGTHDHISLSQIRDSPNVDGKAPFLFLPGIIYKNSVCTSQETHYVMATKSDRSMLFGQKVAVYSDNHVKHKYSLWVKLKEFFILKQEVQTVTTGL
jgi:hypothetical protein